MIYKHQYFTLNTETQEVFNKYGDDVHLSGFPYHLLKYLCSRGGGKVNIADIELIFDVTGNKELNHNNIRQYINTIKNKLNQDVVKYEHEFYSIIGPVTQADSLDELKPIVVSAKEEIETKVPAEKEVPAKKKSPKIKKPIIILIVLFILLIIAAGVFVFSKLTELKPTTKSISANISKPQDEMILIPGGDFTMGSTEQQIQDAFNTCEEGNYCQIEDYQGEYPSHSVNVKDFYIDKKEVSNANYQMFVEATGRAKPKFTNETSLNSPLQPVVGVNYYDAEAYCQWRSARLPTEVEWEKAARGTDDRIYAWGNNWDPKKANHGKGGVKAYDNSDGYDTSAPVGIDTDVSPYGVLNMTGNVGEWTSSIFTPYPGNDKFSDPDFNKSTRVLKGGDFLYGASDCRLATRWTAEDDYKDESTGFRCAKDK